MDILISMHSSASCLCIYQISAYKNEKGKKIQAPPLWGTLFRLRRLRFERKLSRVNVSNSRSLDYRTVEYVR